MARTWARFMLGLLVLFPLLGVGCALTAADIERLINQASAALNSSIDNIQEDPSLWEGDLPDEADDFEGEYIDDPSEDLDYEELLNSVLVAFENDTDVDMLITFRVDGNEESIYVFAGESVLLGYDCIALIELLEETDFDPTTGEVITTFDLSEIAYSQDNGDIACGAALIITIDTEGVVASVEEIDLDNP